MERFTYEMELQTFVDRVAAMKYGETLEGLATAARRITGAETVADVHLDNECPECEGAGYFGDGEDPEACKACHATGNAIRKITLPSPYNVGIALEQAYRNGQ